MKCNLYLSLFLLAAIFLLALSTTVFAEEDADKTEPKEEESKPEKTEGASTADRESIADPKDEHASYLEKERAKIEAEKRALVLLRADVKKEIQRLEKLQKQLDTSLDKRDATREKRISKMVKVYQKMQPQEAVKLLDNLDENLMLSVLLKMKEKQQGKILSLMEPARAAAISEKLISMN